MEPFFINILMSKLQRIKDLVESGQFEEAKTELLADSSEFLLSEREKNRRYKQERDINLDPFNSLHDRGNGRISDGLRFLELTSLFFTGKTVNSMLKFDTVKRYVNPLEFLQNNSNERKIELMAKSLGIESALTVIRDRDRAYYQTFTNILLAAYEEVETGTFRFDDNEDIIALCRGLFRRVR